MPFVNIKIAREAVGENAEAKKAKMARRVVDAMHEETGISKTSFWVVFEEIAGKDWYVGEESVEAILKRRK